MEKEKEKNDFPETRFFTILPKGHAYLRLPYCTIEVTAIDEVMFREIIYSNAVSVQVMNKNDECSC